MRRPRLKLPLRLGCEETAEANTAFHTPPAKTPQTPTPPQSALARVSGQVGRAEGPSATQTCRVCAHCHPAGRCLGMVPPSRQSVLHGCYFSELTPCLGPSLSW